MREKAPIASRKAKARIPWGDPQWKRTIDPDDPRKAEATVDDQGNRNIVFYDTGNPADKSQFVAKMRTLGYDIKDDGWQTVAVISDKEYQERIKKPLEDKALASERRLNKPIKRVDSDGITETDEYSDDAPIDSREVLGG